VEVTTAAGGVSMTSPMGTRKRCLATAASPPLGTLVDLRPHDRHRKSRPLSPGSVTATWTLQRSAGLQTGLGGVLVCLVGMLIGNAKAG
jgi:hypothetical protein